MSFRGRKTFILHSEFAILADDLTYSRRLPRLRESLEEPTRAAAQSQPSKVVLNSTRDLYPRSLTTIRNRHSETVDKALVSRNSVPGPKYPPESVY
ncbi:hypothetical protein Taro_043410 [Colocasia esculenta]|uniref:Uncharacterized protein n=1 Tax=Colocasia esculenta TaxID=4460 RepID=A0A843X1G4_COLES|nr:hypothetical protein [Colocasia esculenta]